MDFYILDVFAEGKYQGNQLAVLLPDRPLCHDEMLKITKEIHFSETSFLLSDKQPNGGYDVRIFTPDTEVPFAGHPTLGTAEVIRRVKEGGSSSQIILNLPAGQIPVEVSGELLTMRQNQPVFGQVSQDLQLFADALSIDGEQIRTDFPIQQVSTGLPCVIVPLKTLEAVAGCRVNHPAFERFLERFNECNLFVFAQEGERIFRVRLFMNDTGYLEDPATGSANGNFAAYLLRHRYFQSDRIEVLVRQGVEMGRPSKLHLDASVTGGVYDLRVGGKTQLIAAGKWL